jgi:hypothetical protein
MIEKTELAHILILEEPNAVVKGKTKSNVCSIFIGRISRG